MGHESDIECFEMFKMTASVSKLEIMVVAWAKVQTITRKVARGRLKFSVRGITIKATTSAKYLGTKVEVRASSQKEVNARVQAASQTFTRLSRNVWKSGAMSERFKVKAFRTLVLQLLLCGTECLLLTKQQENNLERRQTKSNCGKYSEVDLIMGRGAQHPMSSVKGANARPSCL